MRRTSGFAIDSILMTSAPNSESTPHSSGTDRGDPELDDADAVEQVLTISAHRAARGARDDREPAPRTPPARGDGSTQVSRRADSAASRTAAPRGRRSRCPRRSRAPCLRVRHELAQFVEYADGGAECERFVEQLRPGAVGEPVGRDHADHVGVGSRNPGFFHSSPRERVGRRAGARGSRATGAASRRRRAPTRRRPAAPSRRLRRCGARGRGAGG